MENAGLGGELQFKVWAEHQVGSSSMCKLHMDDEREIMGIYFVIDPNFTVQSG